MMMLVSVGDENAFDGDVDYINVADGGDDDFINVVGGDYDDFIDCG